MMAYDMEWAVIVSTMVLAGMAGFIVLLMVLSANRRLRHAAELARAERARKAEVARAEREAVQHTLRELGRELHDNIGQLLTVAQMGLNTLAEDSADARLAASREALDRSVEELRRLAHGFDADLWERRTLADAIVAEADRIERVARVRMHVVLEGPLPVLDADASIVLFRVFQEAVNNALKHSGASTLTITLRGPAPMVLTIADNGRGFDAAATPGNSGLAGIRRRCALVGFEARCHSAPGQGCTWTITQTEPHGAAHRPGR